MSNLIGNKKDFAIEYDFDDKYKETSMSMYINGKNITAFKKKGLFFSSSGVSDDLVEWLKAFLDNNFVDDPFPIESEGRYASIKDLNAWNFDSKDKSEEDKYYNAIENWVSKHNWLSQRAGYIITNCYFEVKGSKIEVSWDNRVVDENVTFQYILGGDSVGKDIFYEVVESFIDTYTQHWN